MNVVDFLKKKREMLSNSSFEMKDFLSPSLRDYWSDISQSLNDQINTWISDSESAFSRLVNSPDTALPPLPAADNLRSELLPQIGEETFVGEWFEVSQERINEFAQVTHDHQWIHTDPQRAAAESPFKTTIAHGFLTMSLIPYLTNSVDESANKYPTAKMTVNYGLDNVRFLYPVRVNAKIRARSRLSRVERIKRGLEVATEITIEVENSRRPAVIVESIMRLYF